MVEVREESSTGQGKHHLGDLPVAFNNSYFPPNVRKVKLVEFMNLEQGEMTLNEYDAKFIELS